VCHRGYVLTSSLYFVTQAAGIAATLLTAATLLAGTGLLVARPGRPS
jgi:hypothetical protein